MVTFLAAPDADYRFQAYVYEDGDASIFAERIGAGNDEYFWGVMFESIDFDSSEEVEQRLVDTVTRLLRHDKRIIQSIGFANVGFECEYADNDGWHSVGGSIALRFSNLVFPKINGKKKEYRASAVLSY